MLIKAGERPEFGALFSSVPKKFIFVISRYVRRENRVRRDCLYYIRFLNIYCRRPSGG